MEDVVLTTNIQFCESIRMNMKYKLVISAIWFLRMREESMKNPPKFWLQCEINASYTHVSYCFDFYCFLIFSVTCSICFLINKFISVYTLYKNKYVLIESWADPSIEQPMSEC